MTSRESIETKLWTSAVIMPSGCWVWQGATVGKGYGATYWPEARRNIGAHRVAYMLKVGPIPPGMCVCHHCDNPKCINPDHLFIGTTRDNALDMVRKGRCRNGVQYGERNGNAKLTAADVATIRREYRWHARNLVGPLARRYGITTAMVCRIVRRLNWKDVP